MKYSKSAGGPWAKASELTSGSRAKLISETERKESQFKDKNGNPKMQDVAKVRFEGKDEALNVNLNRATIYALIDAFGEESKDWMGRTLTVQTEKAVVAGKRVTVMYLVPDGFEVQEDTEGYVQIVRTGEKAEPQKPHNPTPEEEGIDLEAEDNF
jgi:hypothetical protein